jgi:spore maturation protein A
MISWIWAAMLVGAVAFAAGRGAVGAITGDVARAANGAVETAFELLGVMALWLGLTRIARDAGIVDALARLLTPATRHLFPSLDPDGEAMRWIHLNLSANLIGLGSAATPFGLRAMEAMQRQNPRPDEATEAMCTLLALNTTSVTVLPSTMIALRALYGSRSPADIVVPTLLATAVSTAVALILDAGARAVSHRRRRP